MGASWPKPCNEVTGEESPDTHCVQKVGESPTEVINSSGFKLVRNQITPARTFEDCAFGPKYTYVKLVRSVNASESTLFFIAFILIFILGLCFWYCHTFGKRNSPKIYRFRRRRPIYRKVNRSRKRLADRN